MTVSMQTLAADFIRIDADRDAVLRSVCAQIGDDPTFDHWEACRKDAIAGYLTSKPAATDDAQQKFWARLVKAAANWSAENGFDFKIPSKPKAENPEAARKREERANPFEGKSAAEIKVELETIGEVIKSATDATVKAEKAKDYAKGAAALAKAEKAESKEAAKAEADALKPRRDAIVKALKDADAPTLALLENVLIARGADEKAARSAWSLIIATCPKAILLAESAVNMKAAPQQSKGKKKTPATA